MLTDNLLDVFNALNGHFINANKRVFWGYLLATVVLAYLVWIKQNKPTSFIRFVLPKSVWLHDSAKIDYMVWVLNSAIKVLLIVPLLFAAAPIAIWLSQGLESTFGDIANISNNKATVIFVFTVLVFVLDDFTRFFLHWLMHKIPFLWHLHKVHHSAEVLTPFTVYRLHPLESALAACRMVLTQGIAVGIGFYLFGHNLAIYDVLGANIFVFIFNIMGSNLRHSHIWLSWGDKIENWFISPAQHQIHHSNKPSHYHKNLGAGLAIWDRMFGTHLSASEIKSPLSFGVGEQPHGSIKTLYLKPIIDMFGLSKPRQ